MANQKVTALTALGSVTNDDLFYVVNDPAGIPVSNKLTASTLLSYVSAGVSIDNDNWDTTDLAVANGGTGASDAATARTNLGLAIGSDVQAYDAGLADIAALAVTDGNIIVGNGTNWVVESGATARASLGLAIGTDVQAYDADTAKTDVAQEYTAAQNFNATALTDGVNISWNLNTAQVATVTLGGNRTLDNPTNQKAGGTYIVIVTQDATGSRTLAYGTAYKWPGGTAPTLTTTANAVDILTFVSDGTNMYGVAQKAFS